MKKNIVSMVLSLMIFSSSFLSATSVFALSSQETNTLEANQYATPANACLRIEGVNFDDFLASFGDDAVILKYCNGMKAFVVKPDRYVGHFTYVDVEYSVVTMRPGTEPPVEKINKAIGAKDYSDSFKFSKVTIGDEYRFYPEAYEYSDIIFEILKNDENVLSIENRKEITKQGTSFSNSYLYVCSNSTPEEFIAEYPSLKLLGKAIPENDKWRELGYNLVFQIKGSYFPPESPEEDNWYDDLKKLRDSGINFEFDPMIPYSGSPIYAETANRIYQNENGTDSATYKGDVNADNTIDITDLTELSLTLIGDKELTEDQKLAADIDGDGAVTLADLARLQQYLSKKIDSLR